jgi:hypothetical protein
MKKMKLKEKIQFYKRMIDIQGKTIRGLTARIDELHEIRLREVEAVKARAWDMMAEK